MRWTMKQRTGKMCQTVDSELYVQVDELQHHRWTGMWDDG